MGGRSTPNCNGNPKQTCYNVLNPQGGRSTYTVTTTSLSITTAFAQPGITEFNNNFPVTVVQTITLPTGAYYQFGYDSYGELNSVKLATGDTVTYAYTNYQDSFGNKNRWVTSRTSGGGTWNYSPAVITTCGTSCSQSVTVTKPSGDNAVYTFTLNNGAWATYINYYTGAISSANLIATDTKQWNFSNQGGNFIQLQNDTLALPQSGGSSISKSVQYTYAGTNTMSLSSIKEWKFYSGIQPTTPDRETDFTYLTASAYTAKNILNRVQTITEKDVTGAIKFRKDTAYDQGSFSGSDCITGASQHDDANYGCSVTTRGNPTSVTVYTDPVTPGGAITSSLGYDSLGNLRSSTDPVNHTTSLTYADSWSTSSCGPPSTTYSYATTVTNALSQSSSAKYDPCTGLLASLKDPNNQTTSFSYDLVQRPIMATFPDGGQTVYCYTDTGGDIGGFSCAQSGPPYTFDTARKLNSSQSLFDSAFLDGLGRVKQTQHDDPQGNVFTATTYDANGRLSQQYNATRCLPPTTNCGESTWGYSGFSYDGLDRATQATRPDGSRLQMAFSGNTETVTDEAGKKRQYQFDGLGDLSQVTEDPGGLGYVTAYNFDVLGNLIGVTQNGGRQRTYVYDTLSRLTSETNPESGSVTYAYDAASNLTSKTAPAPNQTGSATVTLSFCYDALNRLVSKAYTAQSCPMSSPAAAYAYDVASIDGHAISNPVGRLVKAATSDGLTATWNSYDPTGRIATQWQCTPLNCGGTPYTDTFGLDFLGDHTSETYSYTTGTVTISYAYNGAVGPTSVTSSYVDSQHPATLASGITYSPLGTISFLNYGNNLAQASVFNSRLQPCRINLNSTNTTLSSCTAAVPSGNVEDFSYGFNFGSSDNGNVMSWSSTGQQGFNRSYTFDSLNRLSTLSSPSDPTGCTGLSWTYDPWGNRTDQTVTGGTCNTFHATVNTANQLAGAPYQYDAAGNTTQDASHAYTFDDENRLTQVDGGSTASYVYDAFGRRARKTIGTNTTDYLYDLSNNTFAIFGPGCGGTGCWVAGAVHLNGQFIAEYYNGNTYFVTSDHLDSSRLLTDLNQSIFDSLDFLPFGEQIAGGSGTNVKFTGDERDSETNFDHAEFRQYSSQLGRWMHSDPAGLAAVDPTNPQSWNRYSYVLNNPTAYTDPLGLWCTGDFPDEGCNVGGGGNCSINGVDADCGLAAGLASMDAGAQCPGNYCGPYTGNNGYLYWIILSTEGFSYINPLNGNQFDNGSELGLPDLNDPFGPAPTSDGQGVVGGNSGCIVPRVLSVIPGAQPTGTGQNQGGHQQSNFTFSGNLNTFSPIAQDAFSIFGVNNGYRFGGVFFSLHVNSVNFSPSTNTTSFQGHEDVFNPATGLFGLLGHTIVDLGVGTLFFNHSSRLDRPCP